MKRKLLKNFICFTICSSVFTGLFSVPKIDCLAVSQETQNAIDKTEEEKDRLEGELQLQENKKAELERQMEAESQQLHSLRQQYQAISENLETLEAELAVKERIIETKTKEFDAALLVQTEQYNAMKKRIQYSYETPKPTLLSLFMQNLSIVEILNRVDHNNRIREYDREQMKKYMDTTTEIQQQKTRLEAEILQMEELQKQAGEMKAQLADLQRQTSDGIARSLNAIDQVEEEIGGTEAALWEKSRLLQSLYAKAEAEETAAREEQAQKDSDNLQHAITEGSVKPDESGITYGQLSLTQSEMEMLTAMIYCEARGESYEGQLAVGYVILNRMRSSKFPNDLESVLRQNRQFEPAGSGRFDIVLTAYRQNIPGVIGAASWESCKNAAYACVTGNSNVGECLYFRTHAPVPHLVENLKAAGIPYWIIGNHIFYYSWVKY